MVWILKNAYLRIATFSGVAGGKSMLSSTSAGSAVPASDEAAVTVKPASVTDPESSS